MEDLLIQAKTSSTWRIDSKAGITSAGLQTSFAHPGSEADNEKELKQLSQQMRPLLTRLQASRSHSVLLVFQALDAAGKDSMIRSVFAAQDPAIIKVAAFKAPTELERRHDFLWRTSQQLPARGEMGIFNRSYYEEVLVVRVHENFLKAQYPNGVENPAGLWQLRYEAINAHEKQLAANGTLVLKFWLNVSQDEQKKRFLSRLNRPKKSWKFNPNDVEEMAYRPAYDDAFIDMVNSTSSSWAPWFMIPADDKPRARLEVAKIVLEALQGLKLDYPQLDQDVIENLAMWNKRLRK